MFGGMSFRRMGTLLGALVLAALATLALFGYMRGVEREALARSEPVNTFVADDDIPAGTKADDMIARGRVIAREIPRLAIVDGAITSLDEIRRKIVTIDLVRGQQIVASRFVDEYRETVLDIPDGHQAMSVALNHPPGVAGFVRAGDRISVLARSGDGTDARVQYLLQDVQVLAVGANGDTDQAASLAGGTGVAVLLTLAVTPTESEKLAYAILAGDLYLTLLPPGMGSQQTPGRTAGDLFS